MSLAIVNTRAGVGIDALAVTVEVHLSNGLPALNIVGLPETAVRESKDRVRSAILNAHLEFPPRRITINLAPADLPKEGSRFDLPIALGILAASGQLPPSTLMDYEFIGELALTGELRSVTGVLPTALACGRAGRKLILPANNGPEAGLAKKTETYRGCHLLAVCAHLRGVDSLPRQQPVAAGQPATVADLSDIIGQMQARRALEIAAAGRHNLLFTGPPGTGKTMLASRLPGILPPLRESDAIEVATLYSVSGLDPRPDFYHPPFRSPHHTASAAALVGGGSSPKPGDISLAHRGVLFLDELPEFPRRVLEVLREPLESGEIHLSRVQRRITYPARFQLVAAMNPCPCGYLGSERCRCTPDRVRQYRERISGPLLDRIDLQMWINPIPREQLLREQPPGETSAAIRQRVLAACKIQLDRQGKANGDLQGEKLKRLCKLGDGERQILETAMTRLNLSARGYHRVLRVARTIADLAGCERITSNHLTEALGYRFTVQR